MNEGNGTGGGFDGRSSQARGPGAGGEIRNEGGGFDMGLFLEDHDQKGDAQEAKEEGAVFFGNEMDIRLDDGDGDGQNRQEDFDGQALQAERRQQERDPVACAGDGQAEDEEGRQENDEAFPAP